MFKSHCQLVAMSTVKLRLLSESDTIITVLPLSNYKEKGGTWTATGSGLQITNGQAPVTLSGQTCFCSDTTRFWPVKF